MMNLLDLDGHMLMMRITRLMKMQWQHCMRESENFRKMEIAEIETKTFVFI